MDLYQSYIVRYIISILSGSTQRGYNYDDEEIYDLGEEEEQYEDIERSTTRSRAAQNEATSANEWNPNNIPDIPGQTTNRIGDALRNEIYPTTHEMVCANLITNFPAFHRLNREICMNLCNSKDNFLQKFFCKEIVVSISIGLPIFLRDESHHNKIRS